MALKLKTYDTCILVTYRFLIDMTHELNNWPCTDWTTQFQFQGWGRDLSLR